MELRDAVTQIAEIRQQMARSTVFRGYRPATTAFTGLVAVAGSFVQGWLAPDPIQAPIDYVNLWVGAATVSLVVVAAELVLWVRRSTSPMRVQITLAAVEQFAPCLVAGGLMTLVVAYSIPQVVWMLPGLWAILFGIGMFASRRMVGRGLNLVGGFYLLAGLLILTRGETALSAWYMGATFGAGQLMAAAVLYWRVREQDEIE